MITVRRACTVFVAAALVAGARDLTAQLAGKRPMSIDDIMSMKNVGGPTISPNGSQVVFTVSGWEHPNAKSDTAKGDTHEMRSHVWLVAADGSAPARQITFSERGESAPQFSPDGRWIAYTSNESGRYETYVVNVPEAAGGRSGDQGKWQISTGGGVYPI